MNALSVFPLRAAKEAGIPIRIAHSHSTDNPNELIKTTAKALLRPFSKMYPTHLAACGTLSAQWLFGKAAMRSGDIHYIHNAIDLQRFVFNQDKRHALRSALGISENQFLIGQIGRFSTQKNQSFSIDIMQRLIQIDPQRNAGLSRDWRYHGRHQEKSRKTGAAVAYTFHGTQE